MKTTRVVHLLEEKGTKPAKCGSTQGQRTVHPDKVTCPFCRDAAGLPRELPPASGNVPATAFTSEDRRVMANFMSPDQLEELLCGREVTWKKETAWGPNRRGVYGTFRDDNGREVTVFAGVYRLSTGKWVVCHERL